MHDYDDVMIGYGFFFPFFWQELCRCGWSFFLLVKDKEVGLVGMAYLVVVYKVDTQCTYLKALI